MQRIILYLFLALSLLPATLIAQWTTFTKGDGLTSTQVNCRHIDTRGVIWLGTSNGINAFIGTQWVTVKKIGDNSNEDSQIGNVQHIWEDSKGVLWISSNNGLFQFNGKNWIKFVQPNTEGYVAESFLEDSQGRIWIAYEKLNKFNDVGVINVSTIDALLDMYLDGRWYEFPLDIGGTKAMNTGEYSSYFTSLFEDSGGMIWAGTLEGAYCFDGVQWYEYIEKDIGDDVVLFLTRDSKENIWAGTEESLAKYNGTGWEVFKKRDGLGGNIIYDFFEDDQGRYWASTRKDLWFTGLSLYENKKWKNFKSENNLPSGTITNIMNYGSDGLLASSENGIAIFDGKNWENLFEIRWGTRCSRSNHSDHKGYYY